MSYVKRMSYIRGCRFSRGYRISRVYRMSEDVVYQRVCWYLRSRASTSIVSCPVAAYEDHCRPRDYSAGMQCGYVVQVCSAIMWCECVV